MLKKWFLLGNLVEFLVLQKFIVADYTLAKYVVGLVVFIQQNTED